MSDESHPCRPAAIGPRACLAAIAVVILAACSGSELEIQGRPAPAPSETDPTGPTGSADDPGDDPTDTVEDADAADVDEPTVAAVDLLDAVVVTVRDDRPGRPIDRRLFGTNLPAWVGPDTMSDETFRDAAVASGVTTVRMPGGSWSNGYDWLACEQADDDGCFWTWAARPSDFADFVSATGLDGMWTVSINDTAESAAALVAFFNGSVDDDRAIGVDRDGVDWATVGTWARLRADGGRPDPVRIELWEVGNEVYGGRPDAGGDECASFGWEDVWTCDGVEYVVGDDDHDGYLAIRAAMRDVDPEISVGAVGVVEPSAWSNWGNEVIFSAGTDLDFYVVHHYGFDDAPSARDAVQRPGELWPWLIDGAREVLPADIPLAMTEYNLVSFEAADTDRMMTRAANALFMADTLGRFAAGGVAIANQWNLANGTTSSGTDYGLIDLRDGTTFPQYDAMRLWSRAGSELLDVEFEGATVDQVDDVRISATRRDDGTLAVILVNLGDDPTALELDLPNGAQDSSAILSVVRADDLDDDDLVEEAPLEVSVVDGRVEPVAVPAWSIGVLEVATDG